MFGREFYPFDLHFSLRDIGQKPKGISIDQALPTYCHYSIVELMNKKYVHHVVSTNCDGLHRRSGLKEDMISELHGNCYKEICSKCEKEYLRAFNTVQTVKDRRSHKTGRYCEDPFCKGELLDTTVAFGENLPTKELKKGVYHSEKADLTLVLGTSMRVSPACQMPLYNIGKNGNGKGNLVIVNLQLTPYDKHSTVRSFSKTDEFMELLMKELDLKDFNRNFDERTILIKESQPVKITLDQIKSTTDSRFLSTSSFCKDKDNRSCVVTIGGVGKGQDKYPGIEILTDDGIKFLPKGSDDSITYIHKARWGHSASVISSISKSQIYLIGGFNHQYMYNDVNIYDVANHEIKYVKPKGDPMSYRAGHSACVYKEKIYLFGGQVYAGTGKYDFLNDLYSFDPKTNKWESYETKGEIPKPRSQHQAIIYKNMMLIVGGCDQNNLFGDIYALNLDNLSWKKLEIDSLPQSVQFDTKNIYPAQISCVILKKILYIYGLCHQNICFSVDLEKMTCVKDKTLSFDHTLSSCVSLNEEKAFMWCKKDTKWLGHFIKVE